jgi:hypothetical protein
MSSKGKKAKDDKLEEEKEVASEDVKEEKVEKTDNVMSEQKAAVDGSSIEGLPDVNQQPPIPTVTIPLPGAVSEMQLEDTAPVVNPVLEKIVADAQFNFTKSKPTMLKQLLTEELKVPYWTHEASMGNFDTPVSFHIAMLEKAVDVLKNYSGILLDVDKEIHPVYFDTKIPKSGI